MPVTLKLLRDVVVPVVAIITVHVGGFFGCRWVAIVGGIDG